MHTHNTPRRALALTLTLAAPLATLPACSYITAAAYVIEGPPTIEAQADLDDDRNTVIFVDDRGWGDQMVVPTRSLRREIGRVAENALLAEGVIDDGFMIRSSDALRAVAQEPAEEPMSIVEIGRAVEADVIIYAEIVAFSLSRNGTTLAPVGAANVTILDAQNNERIAPPEGSFSVELRLPAGDKQLAEMDRNQIRAAREGLAGALGLQISKLFYEHPRPARSGNIG